MHCFYQLCKSPEKWIQWPACFGIENNILEWTRCCLRLSLWDSHWLPENRRTPKQNIGNCSSIFLANTYNWWQEEEGTNALEHITPSSLHYKYSVWEIMKSIIQTIQRRRLFVGELQIFPSSDIVRRVLHVTMCPCCIGEEEGD